jgi:hypothetical protein
MRAIMRQCRLCKRNQGWVTVIYPRVRLDGITGSGENALCFTMCRSNRNGCRYN